MFACRPLITGIVLLPGLLAGCDSGGASVPQQARFTDPVATGVAPAALTDLSHWQLTLPVDAESGKTGIAATVDTATLLGGYDSEFFYGTEQDGITFWAPADGAHTANSPYARSELREVLNPRDGSVNWSPDGFASLAARVVVNRVPAANGKVTIGQIVGYNGADPTVGELARLIFEYNRSGSAKIYGLVFPGPHATGSQAQVLSIAERVGLGKPIDYVIVVDNNQLTMTVGGTQVSAPVNPAWADVGLYFRAGAALHARGTNPADGGRVTFYALDVAH
jgi:hypothetical protein